MYMDLYLVLLCHFLIRFGICIACQDPDFVVEPMTTQSTTQSARSSTPPPSPSSTSERRPSSNSGK